MDNASPQSAARGIAHYRLMNNVAVVCQRHGLPILNAQPRVAVLLARHLENLANGDACCLKDAIVLTN